MTDLPLKAFKADDREVLPDLTISSSLDLTGKPCGTYYFNTENNYEYNKNWFNYGNFIGINENNIINEIVQYAKPELVTGTLDQSKIYSLPSTTLTPQWATKIETNPGNQINFSTLGFSGTDRYGNTYMVANYTSNNTTYSTLVRQYNSSGTLIWDALILSQGSSNVQALYSVTDKEGITYIIGTGTGSIAVYSQGNPNPDFTLDMTDSTYLVAYNSNGTSRWITYYTVGYGFLCVDNENIYLVNDCRSFNRPTIFHYAVERTGSTQAGINPTPLIAAGTTLVYGNTDIISVSRSVGGISTITLSKPASEFGLETGMYIAILGIDNDFGEFQTIRIPIQITVSGNTFTYSNNTGTKPYPTTAISGFPIITGPTISSGYIIAKLRSSTGLFQWYSCMDGYNIFNNRETFTEFSLPSMTTDNDGNLIVTGYYTQINSITKPVGLSNPIPEYLTIELPPYSNPVVWTPRETNRNWSAVDICFDNNNANGYVLATVNGGYIYKSTDNGTNWSQKGSIQNWSCVFCSFTNVCYAGTYGSNFFISQNRGETWSPILGPKNWTAIAGSNDGQQIVMVAYGDFIYYISSYSPYGVIKTNIQGNFIDVAYDSVFNRFIAITENSAFIATNVSNLPTWNWSPLSIPTPLIAITGSRRFNSPNANKFFAISKNGQLYGFNPNGSVWTLLDDTVRNYSDISNFAERLFVTVYDGPIYQSVLTSSTDLFLNPTTIPRNWNRICTWGSKLTIATVSGGQIYVSENSYPTRQAFLVKYNPQGILQWITWVNAVGLFSKEQQLSSGCVVAVQSNNNIILRGITGDNGISTMSFFSPKDYDNPIKTLEDAGGNFLVCYSSSGDPLWVNKFTAGLPRTFDATVESMSLCVDSNDNIFCIVNTSDFPGLTLYNPTNQMVYQNPDGRTSMIIEYYPNGFVRSIARMTNGSTYLDGNFINSFPDGSLSISGRNRRVSTASFLNSNEVVVVTEPFPTRTGVFLVRYAQSDVASITFPNPGYNITFNPQFTIGGSTKTLVNGYTSIGVIEIWGGKTGLPPSSIDISDCNSAVISYLNEEPGYTIPIENGVRTFSPIVYNFLCLKLSEPSFPVNDPQPLTPWSIPYGYIPIFISFPTYTTSVVFNNLLNDDSNLILSALGIISADNLLVSGVKAGDIIRIYVYPSQYINLTIEGLILSDISDGIQAGILFRESTRYMYNILNTSVNSTTTLIKINNSRYVPAFYLTPVIQSGNINLITQLSPK